MLRLVSSIFAVAFVVSFGACEQHAVTALPPHYQHKMHHGDDQAAHPAESAEKKGEKEAKDPNRVHQEAIPASPAAKPAENPVKHP